MKFFAMLNCSDRKNITPLVDSDENVALYDTEHEAEIAADGSMLGYANGYTVHEIHYE